MIACACADVLRIFMLSVLSFLTVVGLYTVITWFTRRAP